MIDMTALYILTLKVVVEWTSENICATYLTKVSMNFKKHKYGFETFWSDEPHIQFYFDQMLQQSREP